MKKLYCKDSFILYMFALIIIIIWKHIVETILIRMGLTTMKNIEIR